MRLTEFDSLEILTFSNSKNEFKNHFHDTYVISLIEQGIFTENNLIGVGGNILISHPFEVHNNKIFDNNSYTVTSIYINTDIIQYLTKQKNTSFSEKLIYDPIIFDLFKLYFSTLRSNYSDNSLLIQALKQLLSTYGKRTMLDDYPLLKNPAITESINYIEQNYHTKIKLDDLARIAKQSKYSFIRHFKKNVGITPFEYLNLQRTKQAKKYLREGMSIVDTALSTGYYDQSHFNHYFKHYVGLSPSNYADSNISQDF